MRRVLALGVLALLIGSACGREGPIDGSVAVSAADFSFTAPATVPSGVVSFTLRNDGAEPHQGQLMRLNPGATAAQLIDAAKTGGEAAITPLATPFGGPNGIDPGRTQNVTLKLEPNTKFAFVCLIPDAKGRPHLALGMAREFSTGESSGVLDLPDTTQQATAKDFDFGLPARFDQPITFTNNGDQPHEFQILGIAEGKTAQDFINAFKSPDGGSGPPPYTAIGGAAVILPGASEEFNITLPPGQYFAMCFVTDPKTKAPHFALGMMKPFSVN